MLIVEGQPIRNYREGMSDDELLAFCAINSNLRIERDPQQNIIILSPTGGYSGRIELTIGSYLNQWAIKQGKGVTFGASTGFLLPNGAMRSPDAAWLSSENGIASPTKKKKSFCPSFQSL